MATCSCPAGNFPTVSASACKWNFGQVQKYIIAKKGTISLAKATDVAKKSSWTALTDKFVTPYVSAPTAGGGDVRTFGGGNETPGGIEIILGANPTTMTHILRNVDPAVLASMKGAMCFDLEVIAINGNGDLLAGTDGTNIVGLPIQSFFVSDIILGGFDTPDGANMQFAFPENWSDIATIVKKSDLEFNPLTDL